MQLHFNIAKTEEERNTHRHTHKDINFFYLFIFKLSIKRVNLRLKTQRKKLLKIHSLNIYRIIITR